MNRGNISPWQKAKMMAEGSMERNNEENANVITLAMQGVRKTAAINQVTRTSPKKMYGGVKSKVGGNMKSIRKSQGRTIVSSALKASKEQEHDGPYMDISPAKQTSASSYSKTPSIVKRTMSAKATSSASISASKPQYKSKLAANQMESIVNNIRSRLSQDNITKMS